MNVKRTSLLLLAMLTLAALTGCEDGALSFLNEPSLITGTGAPGNAVGDDGDVWLDTVTGDLYLKTAGAWEVVGEPEIEYWVHTITADEVFYVADDPYGFYAVEVPDSRISSNDWIDFWMVNSDGEWYDPPTFIDTTIDEWFYVPIIEEGELYFQSPWDETGYDVVIFRSPTVESVRSSIPGGTPGLLEILR